MLQRLKPELSHFREKRDEVLDKSFLVIRPDNLPQLLRPVRVLYDRKCAASGTMIPAGEFAYPCHESPIRLAPTGAGRIHIHEAERLGEKILPEGFLLLKIPTADAVMRMKSVRHASDRFKAVTETQARNLLIEGRA